MQSPGTPEAKRRVDEECDVNARTTPWIAAGVVFAVHAFGNAHYGFFRDELYFIICGRHPQWGYVDQPPLVPLLAAMTQMFGHSLWLLRLVPALFASASVYVTCVLVTEFGGSTFAQTLAAIAFLGCLVLTSFGMKVSTDEVNLLTWPLMALFLVRIVKGADPRLWLVVGAIAGITLQSKYSVLFFIAALFVGMLVTGVRATLSSRWFLAGSATGVAIALPNFFWQWHYGFPMWQLLEAGAHGKNVVAGPLLYLAQEVLITNLLLFPVWLVGVVWLWSKPTFRFLGIAYVVLIIEMIVLHGKHYYPGAVYPIVIAAGCVPIERWTRAHAVARTALVAYAIAATIAFLPLVLPILSEPQFIAYEQKLESGLHIRRSITATEHGREASTLPGDWADMHGWPQLAATVQRIYDGLPARERARAVAVTSNYGEASAIAFFTPHVPVISGHNQYWLWGTRGFDGSVVIDVNGDCGAKEHLFRSSIRAATFSAPYAIDYEEDIPIMLCRGLRVPLPTLWPKLKTYI